MVLVQLEYHSIFAYKSLRERPGKHFGYWMVRKMKAPAAEIHGEVNIRR